MGKQVMTAINADDRNALHALCNPAMKAFLTAEVLDSVLIPLRAGTGELLEVQPATVFQSGAVMRVRGEKADCQFRIELDAQGKIAGLWVTSLPDRLPAKDVKPRAPEPKRKAAAPKSPAAGEKAADKGTGQAANAAGPVRDPRSFQPRGNEAALRLPFRGEWYVFWGGDNATVNYHVVAPDQVRATDLVIVDEFGRTFSGLGAANTDYYAYGKEVLAPGNGKVISVVDGIPDNVPRHNNNNPAQAAGNHVILQVAPTEYAVLCHFSPRSLKVRRGDMVRAGQLLGLCGNSGHSTEPHIHFHLQNSPAVFQGTGLTPLVTGIRLNRAGARSELRQYTFLRGDRIAPIE
jgi:murein DD-endopeptidase MepM/ murein hydrolase activator NlpD